MSMVYSLSDLETCVSLREANSEWYRVFQQIKHLLKRKLKQRNPWMEPGDWDLQTWQDCVLVFVARLKWPIAEVLDFIPVPLKKEKRSTTLAVELRYNEQLPDNFTGMQPYGSPTCFVACDHFHAMNNHNGNRYVRDLWTFASCDEPSMYTEIVRVEGDATVIHSMDIEITVPTDIVPPEEEGSLRVFINPGSVTVECENGRYLTLPSDKPHFKNGFFFSFDKYSIISELNNVLVAESHHSSSIYLYIFGDPENNRMIKYPTLTASKPVAFYNGLTWWAMRKKMLVPTFVDQDTNKIHYSPSKTLTGVSSCRFEQTSKLRDCHHFAVAGSDDFPGYEIVNFATGTLTNVVPPLAGKDDFVKIIPGYLNGKFQARFMSGETREKTHDDVMKENEYW